jgi:hypothetical protein
MSERRWTLAEIEEALYAVGMPVETGYISKYFFEALNAFPEPEDAQIDSIVALEAERDAFADQASFLKTEFTRAMEILDYWEEFDDTSKMTTNLDNLRKLRDKIKKGKK